MEVTGIKEKLKPNKSLSNDGIKSKMFRYGRKEVFQQMHK